jgi:cellulose 1,4-beta-cellobiosidase
VPSSGGSYAVDTSNGPTLFDTYAGWNRIQSGREHVLKLVLEGTQHISLRDTNPHLDIHLVQFPSCGVEPLLPTMIGSGTDSVVVENAAPGIYYLVVDGADGAVGTTTLSVSNVLPPAAPDGLVAVGGNGVVNLSWSASAGADSYNVKRGTTNGGPYTTIAPDLTGTSFADNGVTAGTTYYYVATAVNAGGESLPSIQAHATPALAPPAPPATPDLQVASDTGSSSTDNLTNDTTPTFAGTAEDGVTVKILVDGVERGSGVATGGSYSVTTVPIAGGSHVITAQAINAAALASELSGILNITVDTTVPAATVPAQTIANNVQLGTSTVPVNLSWSASDANGITKYELQQSSNGGSTYTNVTLASATATVLTQALTPDTAGSYRFRVRATDTAGNISTYATGPSFLLKQHQETSTAVTYAGTWTLQTVSGASGGSVRYAAAAGTKATFSFTGRTVTWVSTKGTNRGRAEVWLDGARVATIDLYATATQTRRVVFSRDVSPSVAHTLEVRVLGTKAAASTATRVDLDALVVIE